MGLRDWNLLVMVAAVAGLALASTPAPAQQATTPTGIVVNLGIVPAEVALRADGHRDAHPAHPPPGSQHLLVTLEDAASKRIGDADVVVEVKDPHGHLARKPMLHTQAGGLPDYSELFVFDWSGEYVIRVIVSRADAKPTEVRFTVHHSV